MKGLAVGYIFVIFVAIVLLVIFISIITNLFKFPIPSVNYPIDVKYACSQYNGTEISIENLETVLYGFLTDQCNNFSGRLKQTITASDLRRIVDEIDKSVNIIILDICRLPTINSHTLYLCCDEILEEGKSFNTTRKEIKYSDVLICEVS
jgi:hypothetical protein